MSDTAPIVRENGDHSEFNYKIYAILKAIRMRPVTWGCFGKTPDIYINICYNR